MSESPNSIRNVAIIAHVDHGKTTLVDQMLAQSGAFARGEGGGDLVMDSNPIERERGITILSKNCAIDYVDRAGRPCHINIVDTPGHADFSGEVERVLSMADGALLLVDAFEGVMPQTRYVLGKALAAGLSPVVVVNKMDRDGAHPERVVEEVFGLLVDLGADDHAMDFPVVYASARDGWATREPVPPAEGAGDIHAVFDAIITHVPAPNFDSAAPLQALVTTLDYSEYLGRIAIGRVFAGVMRAGAQVVLANAQGAGPLQRIGRLERFRGLGRTEVPEIVAGDLFAVVGLEDFSIGDTIADPAHPTALPSAPLDEPTIQMTFRVNDSPMCGQEGKFVTSRQLRERLRRELLSNVALRVEERGDEFLVSGRGILHLGILIENMRREGYELAVGKAEVIMREIDGKRCEPIELLVVDAPGERSGAVMRIIGERQAELLNMDAGDASTRIEARIPSRALIGLRSQLLTATRGEAIVHHRFLEYAPARGAPPARPSGALIATEPGRVTALAVENLADRGTLFVAPGDIVYDGQVVGEHIRANDLPVNIVRKKKLDNIRSATKDATVALKAPRRMDLETVLEYIEADELAEITPQHVRLRKRHLKESDRRRHARGGPGR